MSFFIIANKKVNASLHHPRGITLSWVNSRCENNRFPHSYVLRYTRKVCNNKHINIISSQTFAENSFPYFIFVLKCACLANIFTQVSISVGVAVSNVHYVFIVLRRVLKRQTIIELTISVVAGLERRNILVENCCWTKCAVPTKWSRVLVPERSLCSACLIIGNVEAFSLPTHFNFFCFFY